MGIFVSANNGGNEKLPTKETVWHTILNKIDEVCRSLKSKLESLFQCFSESFSKGLQAVVSFLKDCCETLKEGLSCIIDEVKKLFQKKEGPVPDQGPSQNLAKVIKMLAKKAMEVVYQTFELKYDSPRGKLNWFFDLAQGFGELFEYALTGPWKLAFLFLEAFIIYGSNKCGIFMNGGLKAKKLSVMVVVSLLSYLLQGDQWSEHKESN